MDIRLILFLPPPPKAAAPCRKMAKLLKLSTRETLKPPTEGRKNHFIFFHRFPYSQAEKCGLRNGLSGDTDGSFRG